MNREFSLEIIEDHCLLKSFIIFSSVVYVTKTFYLIYTVFIKSTEHNELAGINAKIGLDSFKQIVHWVEI